MKSYLGALFGVRVPIREPAAGAPEAARRRASFSEGLIRMPPTFPGFRGDQAETVFRAALAHIGAHYRYSGGRFPVGSLKPMQVALVSLIEDARVEHLAMRDFPGLARLWKPFHVAQASGGLVAQALFARLSRALIDPDFADGDAWVRKGRAMFAERLDRIDDPAISREIGNLLGNDLGQMRVQFNSKTYVVEPAYRDDNLGLWDMGDEQPSAHRRAGGDLRDGQADAERGPGAPAARPRTPGPRPRRTPGNAPRASPSSPRNRAYRSPAIPNTTTSPAANGPSGRPCSNTVRDPARSTSPSNPRTQPAPASTGSPA